MNAHIRIRWDEHYRRAAALRQPLPMPDPILFAFTPPVPAPAAVYDAGISTRAEVHRDEPRAMDLACGVGQNGLWLAQQGYSVDMLDISREALRQAQMQAAQLGARTLNFRQADLDEVALQAEAYDVVCVFRFLKRSLFPAIRAAVRPGGRVIYGSYTLGYRAFAPFISPDELLKPGELARWFDGWQLLRNEETDTFAQIVAVRPFHSWATTDTGAE